MNHAGQVQGRYHRQGPKDQHQDWNKTFLDATYLEKIVHIYSFLIIRSICQTLGLDSGLYLAIMPPPWVRPRVGGKDMNATAIKTYGPAEEIANGLTHGIGAVLSVTALAVLVSFAVLAGDAWRVVSFSIYGSCMTMLYLSSTLYHAFRAPRLKQIFRVFDHAAIFLLIAGTYTPITLISLGGGWGWTLFGLIWGLALFGITLELLGLSRIRWLTLGIYIGMGWLALIAAKPLVDALPLGGLIWLLAGGIAYTGGVVFYTWKALPFNHAIWHLFVLAGSACHFFCLLFYVLPSN